jgi:hypothetical protein
MLTPGIRGNLTQNSTDALAGTSGTAPSTSNKFVDNADTATSGANKVLRLDATGKLPAIDGSQLINVNAIKKLYSDQTASSTSGPILTVPIPANTLSVGKILRGVTHFTYINGNPCNFSFTVSYGGIAIANYTDNNPNSFIGSAGASIEYELHIISNTTANLRQKNLINGTSNFNSVNVSLVQAMTTANVTLAQNLTITQTSTNGSMSYKSSYAEIL